MKHVSYLLLLVTLVHLSGCSYPIKTNENLISAYRFIGKTMPPDELHTEILSNQEKKSGYRKPKEASHDMYLALTNTGTNCLTDIRASVVGRAIDAASDYRPETSQLTRSDSETCAFNDSDYGMGPTHLNSMENTAYRSSLKSGQIWVLKLSTDDCSIPVSVSVSSVQPRKCFWPAPDKKCFALNRQKITLTNIPVGLNKTTLVECSKSQRVSGR